MKYVGWSLIIGVLFSCHVFPNYVEKARIEENLQTKAQHILDTMYGNNQFSVAATVKLSRESWVVSYTDRATIDFENKKNTPSEKYNILPGYSAIKNLSPNDAVQLPFNSKITKLNGEILSITLDIIASKKISKQQVKSADKVLTKILTLNAERGDVINFVFEDFPVNQTEEIKVGLPVEAKLMIFVLIITSVFIIIYILLSMKQLNISKEAVKAQQETAKATAAAASSGGSSAPAAAPEVSPQPVASAPVGGAQDTGGYFSFVGQHNASQFVDVLKTNDLPSDKLSMVLSYLNPTVAKMVMDTLDSAKQIEIISALSNEKIADQDELNELQETLKSQVECAVGGASKLGPIISIFNDESKKTFLSTIQANADIYNKVRSGIFMFEDIEKLEDSEVKKLIGGVNIEILAASIAKDESPAAAKIKSNLSGAAEAMLSQFVDLKKDALTESDVQKSQAQVVQKMKQLNDQGTIDLVSKLVK
jgi:hypothetical protein